MSTSTMRMSEAMRLGAMMAPPIHGALFSRDNGPCQACAIGAALLAVWGETEAKRQIDLCCYIDCAAELWPWLDHTTVVNPVDNSRLPLIGRADMVGIIVVLFENRDWTRERIADWLETVEPE